MLYKEWKTVRLKFWLWFSTYLIIGILLVVIWSATRNQWGAMYYTWLNIGVFLTLVGGIFGGIDLVSEETDKGTLSFLLTRPLSRAYIYLSKLLVNIVALSIACFSVSLVVLVIDQHTYSQKSLTLSDAVALTLLMWLVGVLAIGVSGLISIFTRNSIQTLFCSVVAILPLALVLNLLGNVLHSKVFSTYIIYPGSDNTYLSGNFESVLLLGGLAVVSFWVGARLFERREF